MTSHRSNGMDVEWDACSRHEWNRLSAQAGCSSLEQSWAYGEALATFRKCRIRRAVVRRDGTPSAVVQAFEKGSFLPLVPVRILRGPLWLSNTVAVEHRTAVLRLLRSQFRLGRRELLVWSPELSDSPESLAMMRACDMRQMVTGYATALLDLTRPTKALRAGLRGKWRNRLAVAERSNLEIQLEHTGRNLEWLIEQTDIHRRRNGYVGTPGALARALVQNAGAREHAIVLTAMVARERVAGALVFRHGTTATYVLGWSAPEGRRRQAQNLLLWRAVVELRKEGLEWFDLGGISAAATGIARFKLGMGARPYVLAGTFI